MTILAPDQMLRMIKFLNVAEKLKCELRHSWLSSGRQESVAEHTWRMSLMVILFAPYLSKPVDLEKCLKIAILHDLAEAKVGDIPVFETQNLKAKQRKQALEQSAMVELCASLQDKLGDELFSLWEEYEEKDSFEAQFVNALDKLEVFLQHVEAPLSSWTEFEKDMLFQEKWLRAHCRFDMTLLALAEEVLSQGVQKLEDAGEDVSQIAHRAAS
ncbi:MAG: HD domain-containing protein [Alphaproteobacteria bacterium]|jgi:putative hydrolase of HD superfamily|nr:HD domain-containing protein [Alphaproteobacteria bacterium]MBP7729721.1 HD domain-containing protein [Alphaproteobacteria bacterium]